MGTTESFAIKDAHRTKITLHPSHPYLKHGDAAILQFHDGYLVKWRDFMSVKQDAEFDKFSDAWKFAAQFPKRTLNEFDFEQIECHGETYESMTEWWKEVG